MAGVRRARCAWIPPVRAGSRRPACAEALADGDVDARYNLAVALGHAGRQAEAEAQFRQVLQVAPDRADAHNNLGIVLAGLGRLAEARAEFHDARCA